MSQYVQFLIGLVFLNVASGILLENATVYQAPCIGHSGEIELSMNVFYQNETIFEIAELNGTAICSGGPDPDTLNVCDPDHFIGDVYAINAVQLMFNASIGEFEGTLEDRTMCVYSIAFEVADEGTLLASDPEDHECLQREVIQCCGWDDDGDLDIDISIDNVTGEFLDIAWSCGDTAVCRPPSDASNFTVHERDEFKSFWYNALEGGSIEASCECFFEYTDNCDSSETTHAPITSTETTGLGTTTNEVTLNLNENTPTPTLGISETSEVLETSQTSETPIPGTTDNVDLSGTTETPSVTVIDKVATTDTNHRVDPTEDAGGDSSSATRVFTHSVHFAFHLSSFIIVSLVAVL